jgi:hypothetical protein
MKCEPHITSRPECAPERRVLHSVELIHPPDVAVSIPRAVWTRQPVFQPASQVSAELASFLPGYALKCGDLLGPRCVLLIPAFVGQRESALGASTPCLHNITAAFPGVQVRLDWIRRALTISGAKTPYISGSVRLELPAMRDSVLCGRLLTVLINAFLCGAYDQDDVRREHDRLQTIPYDAPADSVLHSLCRHPAKRRCVPWTGRDKYD